MNYANRFRREGRERGGRRGREGRRGRRDDLYLYDCFPSIVFKDGMPRDDLYVVLCCVVWSVFYVLDDMMFPSLTPYSLLQR